MGTPFVDTLRRLLIRTKAFKHMSTTPWQRRRHPDDVPAPVAVAVADYCRRAQAPAAPFLVREALALLSEEDDERAREMADSEPEARLGPFAVIDVLGGTSARVAAERQANGYYEMVRIAAADHAAAHPVLPPPRASASRRAAPPTEAPEARKARTAKQSVSEKIAPRRRKAGDEKDTTPAVRLPPVSSYLPKRNLPAPRGRFTKVSPAKASFETLLKPAAVEELDALMQQVNTRVALMQALDHTYQGRTPPHLVVADVEVVLKRHGLLKRMQTAERGALLAAILDSRGARGRAAQSLGMKPPDFEHIAEAIGLSKEVEEIRDRFSREALSPRHLGLRLGLLNRGRYLTNLGIEKKFKAALSRDLGRLLDEAEDATENDEQLISLLAKREGLHRDQLAAAVEKLGLLELEAPADDDQHEEQE